MDFVKGKVIMLEEPWMNHEIRFEKTIKPFQMIQEFRHHILCENAYGIRRCVSKAELGIMQAEKEKRMVG